MLLQLSHTIYTLLSLLFVHNIKTQKGVGSLQKRPQRNLHHYKVKEYRRVEGHSEIAIIMKRGHAMRLLHDKRVMINREMHSHCNRYIRGIVPFTE